MYVEHMVHVSTRMLLLVMLLVHRAWSIRCIQCDENEKNKAITRRCLDGQVAATSCPRTSDTHCITNAMTWLWNTPEGHLHVHERQIMWRKCGTVAQISNCTDYRLPNKDAPDGFATLRICSYGCDRDDCFIAHAAVQRTCWPLLICMVLGLLVYWHT